MNVFDYLDAYQNVTLKEKRFNEIDALLFSMVSYVPFDEIGVKNNKNNSKDILALLNSYVPTYNTNERKLKYLEVLRRICSSKRYEKIVFAFFKKERDSLTDKQFQAICLILNQNLYISFCGTDSTIIGWKEDFNMSYLEIVPSEIAAIKYANYIAKKIWFKKIYFVGHSKGGRLAITAAKNLANKKRLKAIYSFDAPNYPDSCYDHLYKEIDAFIYAYAPNESIIGRLMPEHRQKKIICSTNSLLMQHDTFSWLIEDRSFVYANAYTEKSTRIVKSINHALTNYDQEAKRLFVDTLFDILERLNVEKLPNEKNFIPFFAARLPFLKQEWKNTPKEQREVVIKIVFNLVKDYFFGK